MRVCVRAHVYTSNLSAARTVCTVRVTIKFPTNTHMNAHFRSCSTPVLVPVRYPFLYLLDAHTHTCRTPVPVDIAAKLRLFS